MHLGGSLQIQHTKVDPIGAGPAVRKGRVENPLKLVSFIREVRWAPCK